jgi:TPR repeat protein
MRLNVTVNNSLADAAQAYDWYVKAAELGSTDAAERISELKLKR